MRPFDHQKKAFLIICRYQAPEMDIKYGLSSTVMSQFAGTWPCQATEL